MWEVTAGEKLTIPLVHTRRSEFSGDTLQLKTSGEGFEGNPRFDVSISADTSEAVLDLGGSEDATGRLPDRLLWQRGGEIPIQSGGGHVG